MRDSPSFRAGSLSRSVAFGGNDVDQIFDRLWLGNLDDVQGNLDHIDLLFNVCQYAYAAPPGKIVYHDAIRDEVFLDAAIWQRLVESLHDMHHRLNNRVLVHCRLGKSRSPSLVAAYMASCGYAASPEAALQLVTAKRLIAYPHPETWRGVRAWWPQSAPLVGASTLRV